MSITVRNILQPADGDPAVAESVNSALRELSDLLDIQQHLPFRDAEKGATQYKMKAATWNPVGLHWSVVGLNTTSNLSGSWVLAAVGTTQRVPDYQLPATSTEAWAYNAASAINAPLNDIAVSTAGLNAAVGSGGLIATSSNGSAWTTRTPAGGYVGNFFGIAWNGTVFCAVGTSGAIQTSPDGITWTARTAAAAYAGSFARVRWDGTVFIAVASDGEIQTSPDGITWTQRVTAAASPNTWTGIACGPTSSMAVGTDGANAVMAYTLDHGVTWNALTLPITASTFTDAAYCASSDVFCLVGRTVAGSTATAAILMGHPERQNWMQVYSPEGRTIPSGDTVGVGTDGFRFLVVTAQGVKYFSSPALGRRV
jgi:hypothetical protein